MRDRINSLMKELETFKPSSPVEVEEFRIRILGKKGILTALFEEFKMLIRLKRKSSETVKSSSRTKPWKRSTQKNGFFQVTPGRERMI